MARRTKAASGEPDIARNIWVPWAKPKGVTSGLCPPIGSVAFDPKEPTTAYAGASFGCGVLKGVNLGRKVSVVNKGLPANVLSNDAFAFAPTGCDLYAGTIGGSLGFFLVGGGAGGGVYPISLKRPGCKPH